MQPWRESSEDTVLVGDLAAGPEAYALGISGDVLQPDIRNGEYGIFDPSATPVRGDIVAVWWKDLEAPSVVKLIMGVPPADLWDETEEFAPVLVAGGTSQQSARTVSMSKVRAVHKMVGKGVP